MRFVLLTIINCIGMGNTSNDMVQTIGCLENQVIIVNL